MPGKEIIRFTLVPKRQKDVGRIAILKCWHFPKLSITFIRFCRIVFFLKSFSAKFDWEVLFLQNNIY